MAEGVKEEQAGQKQGQTIFGMNAEELAGVAQMFLANKDEAKAFVKMFSPVIGEVTDIAMDAVGPEIHKVILRVSLGSVDIRKQVFDAYMDKHFTEEQAMAFMLSDANHLQQGFEKGISK